MTAEERLLKQAIVHTALDDGHIGNICKEFVGVSIPHQDFDADSTLKQVQAITAHLLRNAE